MLHHMLRAAAQRAFNVLDPYFQYVTMLLHGDGTNGAQNNTFVDSSTNNFTITRNGNTTQGTFSPYGSNWSNYFDGTGDYLTAPLNTAINLGTGDFTFECWAYASASVGNSSIFEGTNNGLSITFNSGKVAIAQSGVAYLITDASNFTINQWVHIAASRSGTSLSLFVNGTRVGNATNSTNFVTSSENRIGRDAGSTYFNGYISNLRIVKGTAVYSPSSTTITVPTTPLTAITNTSLLTCADNRFIDDSTNNFTITRNGDVSVQRFSPFSPTSAYSTSVIGGSGYFDGVVDSLTMSSNAAFGYGTGDFTIELWLYLNSTAIQTVFSNLSSDTSTNPHLYISTTIRYFTASADRITGATLSTGQWYHIALCRSSGSTRLFINGTQSGSTYTDSNNYGTSAPLGIGTYWSGGSPVTSSTVNGYIADTRVLKGTALYTTTFTPPTAPLTAVTNTQLLTNFTNAGILDNAMMNDLETVGNAQISTSVKKYGTGSMYFDGTGDLAIAPYSPNLDLGSGNFTAECWAYPNSSATQAIFSITGSTSIAYAQLQVAIKSDNTWFLLISTSSGSWVSTTTSGSYSPNNWYHIAAVRNGSTFTLYINGTSVLTQSTSSALFAYGGATRLGANASNGDTFNGYIDDLRITKGVARYTTTFTPPTAAFPNN
jgi:hypothetical protein